jgi:hypothetical protein
MQTIIVGAIVFLAAVLLAVRIWRFFTRAPSCSCSQGPSSDCAAKCPLQDGARTFK